MPDPFLARKYPHLVPGLGQENRRIEYDERDAHDRKENQPFFLAHSPARRRDPLKNVVIAAADGHEVREIFRSQHRAEGYRRHPVIQLRASLTGLGDALTFQPEDIREEEEEEKETIFLSDSIKPYPGWIERPQSRGYQGDLDTEELGDDEKDKKGCKRSQKNTRKA